MTKPLSFDWGDGSAATPVDSGEVAEHQYAAPGDYTITVTDTASTNTAQCHFTATEPPPDENGCTITSITPALTGATCYLAGDRVTIKGSGFSALDLANKQYIGLVTDQTWAAGLADVVVVDDGTIIATIPEGLQ